MNPPVVALAGVVSAAALTVRVASYPRISCRTRRAPAAALVGQNQPL